MNRKTADLSLLRVRESFLDRLITGLAAHPYLTALLVCLLLNPLYLGSEGNIPNNATFLETLLVLMVGIGTLVYLYRRSTLWKKLAIPVGVVFLVGILFCAKQYTAAEHKFYWFVIGGSVLILLGYALCHSVRVYRTQCNALLILSFSFLLKILYVLYTSCYTRQHDVGSFEGETGHAAYIQYLIDNHSMPDFDPSTRWQFYHPPLHHIISAIWISLSETVLGVGYNQARESLQTLSLFYAMAIVITGYRILRHFKLNGIALYAPLLLIAFHPAFILFSGSINNDPLSVVFITGAILCTLKWYENQTLKNLLKIALCVGLGMMTKLSAGLIAIPIALVFLVVLIQKIRARQFKIFGHYALFLIICVPLGLWHPIRNSIKFGLPLNYIQKMSETSDQYLGDQSFWSRITDFSADQFSTVFERFASRVGVNENNPLITILKNFLFGEFINENIFESGTTAASLATVFFWFAVELAALALLATVVVCCIKCSMRPVQKIFLLVTYLAMMISLYSLAASEPFVCSMNSRYITPVLLVEACFSGVCIKRLQESKRSAATIAVNVAGLFAVAFALIAACVYLYVCFPRE